MKLIETVYPQDFCRGLDPTLSDACRYLHRVFVDTDEWSLTQQDRLEGLLQLADRHGQLHADTQRRLKSPAPEQFWGKLNELVVASIFESRGYKVEFNPQGRLRREGEFLLFLSEAVFVEVKTMFPRALEKAEERWVEKLCRVAQRLDYPAWVNIEVVKHPNSDFQTRRFGRFLARVLPDMARSGKAGRGVRYEDSNSGLEAIVTLMAKLPSGPVEASPAIGPKWLKNDRYIRASLQAASGQLPPHMPCLVVLCDKLEFPASSRDFCNALYGTLGYLWNGVTQRGIGAARSADGFLSPGGHRRVSVVAQLDELGESQNPYSELVFYHNPWARRPLEAGELAAISRRQFAVEITEAEGATRLRIWEPYGSNEGASGQCAR